MRIPVGEHCANGVLLDGVLLDGKSFHTFSSNHQSVCQIKLGQIKSTTYSVPTSVSFYLQFTNLCHNQLTTYSVTNLTIYLSEKTLAHLTSIYLLIQ